MNCYIISILSVCTLMLLDLTSAGECPEWERDKGNVMTNFTKLFVITRNLDDAGEEQRVIIDENKTEMKKMKLLLGETVEENKVLKNQVTELQNSHEMLKVENKNELDQLKNQVTKLQISVTESRADTDAKISSLTETSKRFQCRSPFDGQNCDQCIDGFYGYPNCESCTCNSNGSVNASCDGSGSCSCKSNFEGDKCSNCTSGYAGANCDHCTHGYFGYPSCKECLCNPEGSQNENCNDSGQCTCKLGFTGTQCNGCATGYTGSTCNECIPGYTGYPNCANLPSQCSNYRTLKEPTRNYKNKNVSGKRGCDDETSGYLSYDRGDYKGMGWYRMMEPAGTKIPEKMPPKNHCGTQATGWLNGSHPTQIGVSVTREVCFNWDGNKCEWKINITVINCKGFFIYNLPKTPTCSLRYCAE